MKTYILFISLLLPIATFAQQESSLYKTVLLQFDKHYNKENYEGIFDMLSPELKAVFPLKRAVSFFKEIKRKAGNIQIREFIKYERGFAVYKTKFDRKTLLLNFAINKKKEISGLFVKPYIDKNIPILVRNKTKLILPFKNEWTVVWGGDTEKLNYHVVDKAQKNAFDIIITDKKGKSYKDKGLKNTDYYAFGKPIFAPCDATVVLSVDGIKDNIPGEMNPIYIPGNTVILKTKNEEYLFFAHFKQHSIKVKEGQIVKKGQVLGLCGNSGNSSEAHLHFHIQNIEDMNIATGAKCYFETIVVNGKQKNDYSPIKGEKIKNK